jgi:hypothetical protein
MREKIGPYENLCLIVHESIADAIRCAEKSLGVLPGTRMQPYEGTTKENEGLIVGFKLNNRKRWRLDYESTVDPSKNREPWGPHVNEENFELPKHEAKVVHRIAKPAVGGELQVFLQCKKWTAAGKVPK